MQRPVRLFCAIGVTHREIAHMLQFMREAAAEARRSSADRKDFDTAVGKTAPQT
jgi:hypothetical protein